MRFGKQKRQRKIVKFYKACFGFREPFKVLCDGTFVHHLFNNISPADTALSTTVGAPVKMFTTRCVLEELKRLGESHSESLKSASNLFIARCDHEKRKTAEACIVEIIANDNHEHFFVATQDYNLRTKFREVPGVPLIYGLRNALYLENPSVFQRQFAKSTEEERSHLSQPEYIMLKKNQRSGSASEEPKDLSDDGGSEGYGNFGTQNMANASSCKKRSGVKGGVQFKRKKAKGPNPLSCKKKKDHLHENLGSRKDIANGSESTGRVQRSRKRKRSQTSQAQLQGTTGG